MYFAHVHEIVRILLVNNALCVANSWLSALIDRPHAQQICDSFISRVFGSKTH